ncbi:DNA modification system-associated small protein [Vibrio coralliirubri]|uniref:DNA modification system-associated small protein n=1 Tax=Vibrio coralliirubri TaxID=1516159 RepID=UPI000A374500|nr:DNA modification system-associated small protein [Vibrio coralliirubri]
MNKDNDPLKVLLAVKSELNLTVDEELIKRCYQVQSAHQYDKERDTVKKMQALVEEKVVEREGGSLI